MHKSDAAHRVPSLADIWLFENNLDFEVRVRNIDGAPYFSDILLSKEKLQALTSIYIQKCYLGVVTS